jgi:hypothetical protein
MTLIIGSEGSMGKRYQAILRYLKEPFECYDTSFGCAPKKPMYDYDRFIIATPTDTHHDLVMSLGPLNKPILCEKPLSKDIKEVLAMMNAAPQLSIMMQYRKLVDPDNTPGLSWYDYFRHGNDGLVWDVFQIIALAKSDIVIREESPVWNCGINGEQLSLANMDAAYVRAVDDWLMGEKISDLEMFRYHRKVKAYEDELCLKKSRS